MTKAKIKHKEAIAQLNYLLVKKGIETDAIKLGEALVALGIDRITDGFWIWVVGTDVEYFSPRFRNTLGFNNEVDFPNNPKSWQSQIFKEDGDRALSTFYKHLENPEHPYYLDVRYRKKESGSVRLICAGTIVNRDREQMIMIGTHEVII